MRAIAIGASALAQILCVSVCLAGSADFTFKRVKPGKIGGRFINIRVEPPAEVAPVLSRRPEITLGARSPKTEEKAPQGGLLPADGWFWTEIHPGLEFARAGRLADAAALIDRHGSKLRPPLSRVQKIAANHGAEILKASAGSGLSPAMILAVISVESAGKPAAKSHAGAVGLMQLMPSTAKRFGVTDRTDPAQNIRGGVTYLSWLLKEFSGDEVIALAAYNAGEGAVRKNHGVPNYKETRAYVPKVVAAWQVARTLCLTPPDRVSDGCVFNGMKLASN